MCHGASSPAGGLLRSYLSPQHLEHGLLGTGFKFHLFLRWRKDGQMTRPQSLGLRNRFSGGPWHKGNRQPSPHPSFHACRLLRLSLTSQIPNLLINYRKETRQPAWMLGSMGPVFSLGGAIHGLIESADLAGRDFYNIHQNSLLLCCLYFLMCMSFGLCFHPLLHYCNRQREALMWVPSRSVASDAESSGLAVPEASPSWMPAPFWPQGSPGKGWGLQIQDNGFWQLDRVAGKVLPFREQQASSKDNSEGRVTASHFCMNTHLAPRGALPLLCHCYTPRRKDVEIYTWGKVF